LSEVKLSEEEWPIERKWKATGRTRCWYMAELEKAVYNRFGEEGLKVIKQVWRRGAENFFLRGLKSFNIEGNDAKAFVSYFKIAQEIMGYRMEIVEASEKKAVLRYHTCHFFEKPDPIAAKLCSEGHFEFERRAAELLNPKLKVRFEKLRSAGDPYCEMIVELED
jgi:hypothetical protein